MKSILNFAIALVALFTVGTASAQNPQFGQGSPCINGDQVCVRLTGLGNNQLITITIEGEARCKQKNNEFTNDFQKTVSVRTDKNGNFSQCFKTRTCPGGFVSTGIVSATVCVFSGRKSAGERPLIACTDAVQCRR
jgi:hypothetical protein